MLYEAGYDADQPFTARQRNGTLAVHFSTYLMDYDDAKCDVNEPRCWRRTLREQHVPASVKLTVPRCPPEGKDMQSVRVFVPVHIDDIRHPKEVYESGKMVCDGDEE